MKEELYFQDEIITEIIALNEIIIYGAGVMGQALKLCLESEPYNKKVQLFIVNSMDGNPGKISFTPVISIDQADEYKEHKIIVALNEANMPGAVDCLRTKGFKNLILLNAAGDDWAHIKANYFLSNPDRCYIPFRMMNVGNGM